MQQIVYILVAYGSSSLRRRAVVGLSLADASWLLELLAPAHLEAGSKLSLPAALGPAVHQKIFGGGIPADCRYTLYRCQKKLPPRAEAGAKESKKQ